MHPQVPDAPHNDLGMGNPKTPRTGTASAVWLSPADLHPNPRNPRVHGADVARLARTILRTTWGAPIIAQASTRRVIGGHGRLEAAKLILAGIEVDGQHRGGPDHTFATDAPGPGVVPVRLVDVSDAEADAMTLADNAKALQGLDDAEAIVAMATAAFERGAPVLVDLGIVLDAEELGRIASSAEDAGRVEAPVPVPPGAASMGEGAEAAGVAPVPAPPPAAPHNDAVPAQEISTAEAFGALPTGDREPFQQMTFTLHDTQAEIVRRAIERAKAAGPFHGPNANSNGNALARMAEAYLG